MSHETQQAEVMTSILVVRRGWACSPTNTMSSLGPHTEILRSSPFPFPLCTRMGCICYVLSYVPNCTDIVWIIKLCMLRNSQGYCALLPLLEHAYMLCHNIIEQVNEIMLPPNDCYGQIPWFQCQLHDKIEHMKTPHAICRLCSY